MNLHWSQDGKNLNAIDICRYALFGAMLFVSQLALSALPNIHITALLITVYARLIGARSLYAVLVYVLLEGLLYGFGIWWISYLYIWPLLAVIATACRHNNSSWVWAVLTGCHGFLFGAMCAIPYFFSGGAASAFAYWVSGIPFDLIHGISNFIMALLLSKPLYRVFSITMHT